MRGAFLAEGRQHRACKPSSFKEKKHDAIAVAQKLREFLEQKLP